MNTSYKKQIALVITLLCLNVHISRASITEYIPFLKSKTQQETMMKEYTIAPECIINIKGAHVNVRCTTWEEKKVHVTTKKEVPEKASLSGLSITDFVTPHSLTLSTQAKDNTAQGSVSFELKIPQQASLTIKTDKGDIFVKGPIAGKIHAETEHGNITLEQTRSHVVANSNQTGSITIADAHAPVKAVTNKGNILITQSHDTVFAQANSGNISLKAHEVPCTATVRALSQYGLIAIELPKDVNADLQALAKKGTITCQHPVTLKPRTTTLDQKAWKLFKEQVDGILGSGEASIVLQANKGNIKILAGQIA